MRFLPTLAPGLLLLLVPTLGAGLPTAGKRTTLVLCPDVSTCAEEMMWVSGLRDVAGDSVLLADAVLELENGNWSGGEMLGDRFREDLGKAREDLEKKRLVSADSLLEDARQALDRWTGTATNQELFELYYLRGALRVMRGDPAGESMREAAALLWNRTAEFPIADEKVQAVFYEAQRDLVAQGVGILHLESMLPGAILTLDGVPLGTCPLEVRAFPGRHRLTATQEGTRLQWRREVYVRPGDVTTAEARFDRSDDASWVYDQLLLAITFRTMDPAVANLLAEWSRRENVRTLRLARAELVRAPKTATMKRPETAPAPEVQEDAFAPGDGEVPVFQLDEEPEPAAPAAPRTVEVQTAAARYRLHQVVYDPQLRRFVD